jgi:hypothetical protein
MEQTYPDAAKITALPMEIGSVAVPSKDIVLPEKYIMPNCHEQYSENKNSHGKPGAIRLLSFTSKTG